LPTTQNRHKNAVFKLIVSGLMQSITGATDWMYIQYVMQQFAHSIIYNHLLFTTSSLYVWPLQGYNQGGRRPVQSNIDTANFCIYIALYTRKVGQY
jgi:hypothetical protein